MEILVLGDSHANIFAHTKICSSFPQHEFTVVSVAGASIAGLVNPNSATQAMPLFMAATEAAATTAKVVIVMLGEVDLGFLIWWKAENNAVPVDKLLQRLHQAYQDFLLELTARFSVTGSFNVIWVSTPLPTITDGQNWGDVANKRREIKASQLQRTQLTRLSNIAMEHFCRTHGIRTVMLDTDSVDENGLVKQALINDDPLDHHYHQDTFASMVIERLKPILTSLASV